MSAPCWSCGCTDTQYQAFSGGREFFCPQCDDVLPYRDGEAPRRVQMLADGKFDELRMEMRDELGRRESREALSATVPPQEAPGQCETAPAVPGRERGSQPDCGASGDESSGIDRGAGRSAVQSGPGDVGAPATMPDEGPGDSEAHSGAEASEAWARRFVPIADQIHAVITRHYGDCPDRDGDPLCSEIAEAVTEVAR